MSRYTVQAPGTMRKSTQSDWCEGFDIVRTITAADVGTAVTSMTPGYCDAQRAAETETSKRLFRLNTSRTSQYRVFSNRSGGTVSLQFIFEAPPGPRPKPDNEDEPMLSLPTTVLAAAFTCSGRSCVNFNPITGVADSDTWYEASDWTAAFVDDNRLTAYPASAGGSYQKFFGVDNLGDLLCYPCCYAAPSSSGTVIVAARRVD